MGKDKNGGYIPPKGKPSGNGKETHGLMDAFAGTDPETDNEIANKYTEDGGDKLAPGVYERHANRMVQKDPDVKENNNNNNSNNG